MSNIVFKNGIAYTASNGRMMYHPEYHFNQGKPWTTSELMYLCGVWGVRRVKDISMALGRTEGTCLQMKYYLKKRGEFEYYREQFKKQ